MLFGKKSKEIVKIDTLVGIKAVIDGNLTGGGNYKIDGKINGDIEVSGDVIIDKRSVINGSIRCHNLICGGTVNGNIFATNITYRATAVVNGDSTSKNLVIEEGAKIIGNCSMKHQETVAPEEVEEYEL